MERSGTAYQEFLDAAFLALYAQNKAARRALLATGAEPLTHDIGANDATETVLTSDELCSRLVMLRSHILARKRFSLRWLIARHRA